MARNAGHPRPLPPGFTPVAAVHLVLVASTCLITPQVLANTRTTSARPSVEQSTRWAAEPLAPATAVAAPDVTHPTWCAGVQSPGRTSPAAQEIKLSTTRRTTRTRRGGRLGP